MPALHFSNSSKKNDGLLSMVTSEKNRRDRMMRSSTGTSISKNLPIESGNCTTVHNGADLSRSARDTGKAILLLLIQ